LNLSFAVARRLRQIVLVFVLLVVSSVVGYILIEGYSLIDAIYMTVITLSTVGFGEVQPLSPLGRVFTSAVVLVGVGTAAFLFSTIADYIVAGHLGGSVRMRHVMRTIDKLQEHTIVCGYGRVGEHVSRELDALGVPFVVIEQNAEALERCEECNFLFIAGDATADDTLRQAGIERARGLVAALNSDADNVFVVLSARVLNPDLTIVTRAASGDAEHKLRTAGADRVISPYQIAGHRIVRQLTRPHVISFLETAMGRDLEFFLEEIQVASESSLVGQSMREADLRLETGANVLSVIREGGQPLTDWSPELQLEANDILIVLGKQEQLKALAELAGDSRVVHGA